MHIRVAVPIFFMITGYFYGDTVARHKENRQIRKIFYLVVEKIQFSLFGILRSVSSEEIA